MNNVGIGARACIQQTDMATFDDIFNINVRGVYNLTRLLVPHLLKTKGNIVNVSSIMVSNIAVGSLPYDMAKVSMILYWTDGSVIFNGHFATSYCFESVLWVVGSNPYGTTLCVIQ